MEEIIITVSFIVCALLFWSIGFAFGKSQDKYDFQQEYQRGYDQAVHDLRNSRHT
jgi:hypothetical protein